METIFRLKASEVDNRLLTTLKTLYEKREIEITVTGDISDETDFLMKDPANKAHLLEAIEEVKHNKNLVRFTAEGFEEYSKSLLKS